MDPAPVAGTERQAVNYFRPRRLGPEAEIEDMVAARIPDLFASDAAPIWTAGSVPLGAGMPDLVIAAYKPLALALATADLSDVQILGYLRAVKSAKLTTIADRLSVSSRSLGNRVHRLIEARAVDALAGEAFCLTPSCRELLPEIITIEVKVQNWQKAADQARRNRILSHRSFVALPSKVAERVRKDPAFTKLGLGLLAVDGNGEVDVLRQARRGKPSIWTYYYQLAALVGSSIQRGPRAF